MILNYRGKFWYLIEIGGWKPYEHTPGLLWSESLYILSKKYCVMWGHFPAIMQSSKSPWIIFNLDITSAKKYPTDIEVIMCYPFYWTGQDHILIWYHQYGLYLQWLSLYKWWASKFLLQSNCLALPVGSPR